MTEKQDELLLTDEDIWAIQFAVIEDFKKQGKLPSTAELDRPVAQAQLAKARQHYHDLMLKEYERGLADGKALALPSPGSKEWEELREKGGQLIWEFKVPVTAWEEDALPEYVKEENRCQFDKILSLLAEGGK